MESSCRHTLEIYPHVYKNVQGSIVGNSVIDKLDMFPTSNSECASRSTLTKSCDYEAAIVKFMGMDGCQ